MKLSKIVLLICGIFLSINIFGAFQDKRDKLIGNLIKKALESYHYRNLTIDDTISELAFKEFLKRMDYSKQFYTKGDISKLEKFKTSMDDELVSGNHVLLVDAMQIMEKRVKQADGWRKTFFAKDFDLTKKESLELDPEKRNYSANEKELKDLWRKLFKQATLSRYLVLKDEQDEEFSPKKDSEKDVKKSKEKEKAKNDKPLKKLTDKELREKALTSVNEKYEKFFSRLLKEDHDDNLDKFFNSISSVFDPHTNYLPPKRKEDFDIDISGSLEGIGAVLQEEGSYIKVVSIVPGGAAWRQKDLAVDDVILRVKQKDSGEEVDLVDMRVDDAVRYIRGKKGSTVVLTVKKVDGSRKNIPIERDVIQIGASFAKSTVITHDKLKLKVGYINVPKFYRDFEGQGRNCTDDVKKELIRLKKEKVDGVILDLRNNGGGALEDARQMSGLFIKEGPIVQIRNHTGEVDVLTDTDPSVTYDGPLIVMINRFSASASEILAGALQDYKRAVIVGGEFTHGKGTVQAVLNLNQGPLTKLLGGELGALKVTIQKFYRITGASTQRKGITPDIALPDPFGHSKTRELDLENSLPWDRIAEKKFNVWNGAYADLKILKERSEIRVKKDERFQKTTEMVDYLIKRRDDTKVSLNLAKNLEEDIETKKMNEKFKIEKESMSMNISHFEESLKESENYRKEDEAKWKEDFIARKDDWLKKIRLDSMLEESMFIINDMYDMEHGKPLLGLK